MTVQASLIFTLPHFNEPGFQTYVMVGNWALLDDHLAHARTLGIVMERWVAKQTTVNMDTQLVFLTLESAVLSRFKEYVNALPSGLPTSNVSFVRHWSLERNRVIQFITDEVHQLLSDGVWCDDFLKVKGLTQITVQKIFIMVTLPP